MLESMGTALTTLTQPQVMLFIALGAFLGLVVGLVPGIGNLTVVAMMLPIIWMLPPELGLSFLIGMIAAAGLSDCITTILIGIPGEGPSMATIFDGYALNKKGEGARAVGAGIFSSIYSGLASASIVIGMVFVIRPIVLTFGSAELLLMIVLGLSFVVVLSGRSIVKGLISGGLGLILSMVGYSARSMVPRFTFGSAFLYDGINLAVLGMGLFGIAILAEEFLAGQAAISLIGKLPRIRDVLRGVKDVFHHWRIFWLSVPVSTFMGMCPGIGRNTAAWTSLGLAKKVSKNPEEFGTGRIEGVIAPEAANNSTSASSLLITLSFGVPSSAIMALFAAALLMVGITPGPALLRDHLDMVYLLIFGILAANVIGGIVCLFGAAQLARIAFVSMDFLFPGLIAVIFVASYATQESIMVLLPLLVGSLLGITMTKFRYPLPPLILAFVLGKLFEYYLFNALDWRGPLFFLRPVPIVVILIIIALYGFAPLKRIFLKARGSAGAK